MIGGIFETIGKTLGVGKEKYFLELDDAAEDTVKGIKKAASKAAIKAKDVASDVVEKAQDLAGEAVDKIEDAVGDAADKSKEKTKDAAEKVQETAKQASDASEAAQKKIQDAAKTVDQTAKQSKKTNAAKADQAEKTNAPVQTAATTPDPDEIIVNAIAAGSRKRSGNGVGPNGEALTFSTDYLMPQKKMRRRRPGPSFSSYKGMAKDVNPRLK